MERPMLRRRRSLAPALGNGLVLGRESGPSDPGPGGAARGLGAAGEVGAESDAGADPGSTSTRRASMAGRVGRGMRLRKRLRETTTEKRLDTKIQRKKRRMKWSTWRFPTLLKSSRFYSNLRQLMCICSETLEDGYLDKDQANYIVNFYTSDLLIVLLPVCGILQWEALVRPFEHRASSQY